MGNTISSVSQILTPSKYVLFNKMEGNKRDKAIIGSLNDAIKKYFAIYPRGSGSRSDLGSALTEFTKDFCQSTSWEHLKGFFHKSTEMDNLRNMAILYVVNMFYSLGPSEDAARDAILPEVIDMLQEAGIAPERRGNISAKEQITELTTKALSRLLSDNPHAKEVFSLDAQVRVREEGLILEGSLSFNLQYEPLLPHATMRLPFSVEIDTPYCLANALQEGIEEHEWSSSKAFTTLFEALPGKTQGNIQIAACLAKRDTSRAALFAKGGQLEKLGPIPPAKMEDIIATIKSYDDSTIRPGFVQTVQEVLAKGKSVKHVTSQSELDGELLKFKMHVLGEKTCDEVSVITIKEPGHDDTDTIETASLIRSLWIDLHRAGLNYADYTDVFVGKSKLSEAVLDAMVKYAYVHSTHGTPTIKDLETVGEEWAKMIKGDVGCDAGIASKAAAAIMYSISQSGVGRGRVEYLSNMSLVNSSQLERTALLTLRIDATNDDTSVQMLHTRVVSTETGSTETGSTETCIGGLSFNLPKIPNADKAVDMAIEYMRTPPTVEGFGMRNPTKYAG
ncbi:TPA: hypothetical protein PXM28_004048 [Yersinia enterocolitica]|nr:hypothetical protein [Yersinia enterocolitica]